MGNIAGRASNSPLLSFQDPKSGPTASTVFGVSN